MNAQPTPEKNEFVSLGDRLGSSGQPVDPKTPSGVMDRVRQSPRQWIAIGVGLIVVIVALVWAMRSSSPSSPAAVAGTDSKKETLPLVSVMTPRASAVTTTVTFSGAIGARYDIPIGVEGESGRITDVLVEVGDQVRRGQVLARQDRSVLVPQLNRLAASLEEARAQAALSAAEYERALGVQAAGALSKEEIERRRATAATDDAKVKVAAAQLAEAQARLGRADIRAPANGIVLTRDAEIGQMGAAGGAPLFRIARDGEIEMRGQIAEQDLPNLRVGQLVDVYVTGIAQAFEGKIRLLGAVIDPQTRLGEVRVILKPDPRLRPGAFARGEANIGQADRPILPKSAVLADGTQAYVMVVNADGKVSRRAVKIGQASADGIVIVDGLTGDERIVTTAAGFLRDGEKVEVASPTAQAKTP